MSDLVRGRGLKRIATRYIHLRGQANIDAILRVTGVDAQEAYV